MRYLFFDIEGANSYDFVSKMCTFGYVITDDHFNVNLKIDVVINPEASFDRHILRENMNAYPLEKYENSPAFSYFYQSIKGILETKGQIIAGWSVENDVKYIYDACKRYKLNQIQYKYVDIQKIYMDIFNLSNAPSLETACEELKIDISKTHKSDEDAMLTMLVTKELCRKLNFSFEMLVEKFKKYISSVKEYDKKAFSDEEIAFRIEKNRAKYAINRYIGRNKAKNKRVKFYYIYHFTSPLIDSNPSLIASLARYLKDCGANCTVNYKEATHIICLPNEKVKLMKSRVNEDVRVFTINGFIKLIGYIDNK